MRLRARTRRKHRHACCPFRRYFSASGFTARRILCCTVEPGPETLRKPGAVSHAPDRSAGQHVATLCHRTPWRTEQFGWEAAAQCRVVARRPARPCGFSASASSSARICSVGAGSVSAPALQKDSPAVLLFSCSPELAQDVVSGTSAISMHFGWCSGCCRACRVVSPSPRPLRGPTQNPTQNNNQKQDQVIT